jgi:hypothetical protein
MSNVKNGLENMRIAKEYQDIQTARDLKKNKLSLSDYRDLGMTLQSIIDVGSGTTLLKNVAEWCKRKGLKVQEESICFRISK